MLHFHLDVCVCSTELFVKMSVNIGLVTAFVYEAMECLRLKLGRDFWLVDGGVVADDFAWRLVV